MNIKYNITENKSILSVTTKEGASKMCEIQLICAFLAGARCFVKSANYIAFLSTLLSRFPKATSLLVK